MRKRESGITLIALVITIIVILILAGITIGSLTGDNSIIDKAGQAKNETELASAREKVEAEYIMCLERGELNADKFKTNIKNSLGIEDKDIIDNGDGTWTIKFKGTDINTGEKEPEPFGPGVIVAETENEEWIDKDGDKAIIPGGFGIVPGLDDVSEGLVITDKFDSSGKSIGNEFVWVPVNKAISTTGFNASGDEKPLAYNNGSDYYGIIYSFNSSLNTSIWCGLENIEPNLVEYYDRDMGEAYNNLAMGDDRFLRQMKDDFKEMALSVEKNKGFYVGRYIYRVNNNGVPEISKQGTDTQNPSNWYQCYRTIRNSYVNENVKANMIWASQFSAILNWLMTDGQLQSDLSGTIKNIVNIYSNYPDFWSWTMGRYSNSERYYIHQYTTKSDTYLYGAVSNSSNDIAYPTNSIFYSTRATLFIK